MSDMATLSRDLTRFRGGEKDIVQLSRPQSLPSLLLRSCPMPASRATLDNDPCWRAADMRAQTLLDRM